MRETMVVDVPVSILLEKLQKLLDEERLVFPGLRNRVTNAINELSKILIFLEAENTSINEFKSKLLHTIYSAKDTTESFVLTTAQRRQNGIFRIIRTPLKLFPIPSWRQLQFSCEMKKFVNSLKDVSDEISKMTLQPIAQVSALGGGHNRLYDQEQNSALVGREDDEKELVARLFDENENSLRVISLVCEEPLGKTALVRNVYNRLDIRQHFQCRAWLHVHKDFTYKDMLLIILKQIPICVLKDVGLMSEKEVCAMLFKILMEVRFLIVLDDVCAVDVWLMLACPFADAANGSRVILTTRSSNIQLHADPWSFPLNLMPLTDEGSWSLFLKKVGRSENSSDNTDINSFRERILRVCHGLPSAIVLLGGVLSRMRSSEWSEVINLAHFDAGESPLLKFVALSYQKLPSVLKPCFLYFVLFPKGYEIPTRRLFRLWLAEGFVQISPNASDVHKEDVPKKYLEELLCRNMIEIARRKSDGTPKTCRMPCYLYDVFLPKAEEIGFLHVHHSKSDYCTSADSLEFNIRRLADQFGTKSTSEYHVEHLCSYISFDTQKQDTSNREIGTLLMTIIKRGVFVLLKVLDLEGVYKPLLPDNLGVLQNLRYIGLRWTGLDSCPASIGDLPSLETLDLKYTNITTLPSPIWKIKRLRHVYMNEVSILKPSKESSTNLHTLMGLLIGSKDPKIYGLDRCTSLRKLGLTCNSISAQKTAECISQLDNLQTLRLRSRDPFGQPLDLELSPMKDHQSLSNLHLFGVIKDHDIGNVPKNLKILKLSMSKLENDPMLVLGELPHLNTLRLFAGSYVGSEMACLDGHFPKLRVLKLWKLERLEQWTVEKGSMSQLVELEIRGCEELKRTNGLEQLPALKELILTNMLEDFVADFRRRLNRDLLVTNKWELEALQVSFVL